MHAKLNLIGVSLSCKNHGKPWVLHDFDTSQVEWPYIQWQLMKESNIFICLGRRLKYFTNICSFDLVTCGGNTVKSNEGVETCGSS